VVFHVVFHVRVVGMILVSSCGVVTLVESLTPDTRARFFLTFCFDCQQEMSNLLGGLLGEVLLEHAHELGLLLGGLEAAVTVLGRGVDELEGDLLEGAPGNLVEERLAESDDPLLGTTAAPLEHHEVLHHGTVVGEATHGGYALLREIELGRGVLVLDRAVSLARGIA